MRRSVMGPSRINRISVRIASSVLVSEIIAATLVPLQETAIASPVHRVIRDQSCGDRRAGDAFDLIGQGHRRSQRRSGRNDLGGWLLHEVRGLLMKPLRQYSNSMKSSVGCALLMALLGIALSPAAARAFAYIADSSASSVSVIDTATSTIVGAPIPVGNGPWGVAIT